VSFVAAYRIIISIRKKVMPPYARVLCLQCYKNENDATWDG